MNIGLRSILILVAIVLFVVAVFSDTRWADLVALGLACMAASFVVDELGIAPRLGTRRS